ncbi:hypothetical protein SAMN05421761_10544 [Belliella pelovolcani]|uniref:Uncharacterized protein n=2 Tax=Belliella pelovolcani TaxID=529505 RepID=A0A1N7M2Z2_9BACT|nr:hypothetical protein SAMN05421761_10544 [Belliella pelovolcani]
MSGFKTVLKMKLNFKVLKYSNLIVFVLFYIMSSCYTNSIKTEEFLKVKNADSVLVFIDLESCSSCTEKISELFRDYFESEKFDFVFIENQNLKEFKIISGVNFKQQFNIHKITNENYLKLNGGYGSYLAMNSGGYILNPKKVTPSNFDGLVEIYSSFLLDMAN